MMSVGVQGLFQLLGAGTWLKKSEVAQRQLAHASCIRKLLEEEARLALQRGDIDDASNFAAHVSLLNDVERYGLAAVQAEIIRVTRCCAYLGSRKR